MTVSVVGKSQKKLKWLCAKPIKSLSNEGDFFVYKLFTIFPLTFGAGGGIMGGSFTGVNEPNFLLYHTFKNLSRDLGEKVAQKYFPKINVFCAKCLLQFLVMCGII
jgi:hypothetical protein